MFKNFLKITLIIAMVIGLTGCGELARKFIRKSSPKKEEYAFYQVEEYKAKPALQRYQNHYILWHNWQAELVRSEGTSYLRDIMSANEALKHLTSMRDLLADEQAKKLDIEIADLESVIDNIEKRRKCVKDSVSNRRTVERVERIVLAEFSYKRMYKYIKAEE